MRRHVRGGLPAATLLRLHEPVRRYLARHTADPHELEDLTQETLARVWEARRRIHPSVAASYAVATARNLVLSERRREQLHVRHQHRLLDPAMPDQPHEALLRAEEHQAVARALVGLSEADRQLLSTHYLTPGAGPDRSGPAGRATGPAARGPGVTSRLARSRGRARVGFLLALRRVDLPTPECRGVLDALSAGDRRLQQRVGAAPHLLACQTCSACAPALLGRQRVLFGILAAPLLIVLEPVRRAYEQAPRTTVGVGVAAGVVVAALAAGSTGAPAPAAPPAAIGSSPPPLPTSNPAPAQPPAGASAATSATTVLPTPVGAAAEVVVGQRRLPVELWGSGQVTAAATQLVRATAVPVQSVPADEGFWVGTAEQRFWVQLQTDTESPQQVRPGDLVSFVGRATAVPAGTGPVLTDEQGRADLARQAGGVSVSPEQLQVVAASR